MTSEAVGELLDDLQKRVDRCKVLFEQYFLGIQKTPPHQLQIELERKIRKLTQTHISNTGLRFRFTTLSQKFASYNTYWKRTMRAIENGSYIRDIAKLGRDAVRLGKDVPEELLAKMPKRMRERILQDRASAKEVAQRSTKREEDLRESGKVRDSHPSNVHLLDGDDLDALDLDQIFSEMQGTAPPAPTPPTAKPERRGGNTDVDQLFAGAFASDAFGLRDDPKPKPAPGPPHVAAPARPPAVKRSAAKRPDARRPPPVPRAPAAKKPEEPPPPGMSVSDAQALYKRYRKARELVGQDTSKLNYNRLMRSLNKQAPKIIKQHNARTVKFDVVVKDNQVILKAKPEK